MLAPLRHASVAEPPAPPPKVVIDQNKRAILDDPGLRALGVAHSRIMSEALEQAYAMCMTNSAVRLGRDPALGGMRTIDPADPAMRKRYGLSEQIRY
jgi:hypothetical protein